MKFVPTGRQVVWAVLVAGVFCGAGRAAEPEWQAGVAVADITPERAMWMGGYGARTRPSEGVAQPLRAKALALADGAGGRFVFLTFDAIGIPRELRLAVAQRLERRLQLRADQFVLAASHTHSGPEFRRGRVPAGDPAGVAAGAAYLERLETTLAELAGQALAGLAPARVGYARARAGFAMNRRLPRGGDVVNAPNPDGPVDHDVPVLRVEGADRKLRAVLFGYACHNTTLTQTNYRISADYAGWAQHFLEAEHPDAVALFVTGGAGDQNPYPRGTPALAEAHGRTLATAVGAALGTTAKPVTGTLRSAQAEIGLRYAEVPDRAELERRRQGRDRMEAEHAQRMLERLAAEGGLPAEYPYPVQVVALGDGLTFVALGGEVVVDYPLRLKRELGGPGSLWFAGYANDVLGYIPSERVRREGGYEGRQAMRIGSLHPGLWAEGLEERIVATVHRLVREVRP